MRNKTPFVLLMVALAAFLGASVPPNAFAIFVIAAGALVCVWLFLPDLAVRDNAGSNAAHAIPPSLNVRAVIADVDGTLTNGLIHRLSDGAAMRSFHSHDGLGHRQLVAEGISVAWLSATSERASIDGRAAMLDHEYLDIGSGDKGPRFLALCERMGVEPARVVYVGDDVNDLPAMALAGFTACPADAHPVVRRSVNLVLHSRGGEGAFRELADLILGEEPPDAGTPERV